MPPRLLRSFPRPFLSLESGSKNIPSLNQETLGNSFFGKIRLRSHLIKWKLHLTWFNFKSPLRVHLGLPSIESVSSDQRIDFGRHCLGNPFTQNQDNPTISVSRLHPQSDRVFGFDLQNFGGDAGLSVPPAGSAEEQIGLRAGV